MKYILIMLLALAGCGSDPVVPNRVHQGGPAEEGLIINFQLTDRNGNPTTDFLFGRDIFFKIEMVNQTGEDQPWTGGYHLVPFGFCVVAVGTEPCINLGSTFDGSLITCEPDSGILEQGATVTHDASWSEYPGHIVLPAGEYIACVGFSFRFKNIDPEVESIAFTVLPTHPNEELIFSMFHMPAMGFCPAEGRFLWAHVIRYGYPGIGLGFRHLLVGERVVELGLGVPGCPPDRPCPVTVPITPLILDENQERTLQRLMAEFPNADPLINHACDPCYITLYNLGSKIRRVGACVYGPPDYYEQMNDLEQFIESLVPVETTEGEFATFPSPIYQDR